VILPATKLTPQECQHRPHPSRPLVTVCDRIIGDHQVVRRPHLDMRLCTRCEHTVARSRRCQINAARRELGKRRQSV
jgi:hypothetical protein